ncbi:hypothetical protein ACFQHO_34630 [Actinomadura yumaensis]|uniref:hypothetical protein n=1 Tax=Actinomadura yumaensis TaxID=111807 RepID=UPI003623E8B1
MMRVGGPAARPYGTALAAPRSPPVQRGWRSSGHATTIEPRPDGSRPRPPGRGPRRVPDRPHPRRARPFHAPRPAPRRPPARRGAPSGGRAEPAHRTDGPQPLISTRALAILLTAGAAGGVAAAFPSAAIPIGVVVAVLTLLAQIVRD